MEPALDGVEPRSFPEPNFWPEWQPFTRGRYALTYDPSYTPETEETETAEAEETDSTKNPPPVSEIP